MRKIKRFQNFILSLLVLSMAYFIGQATGDPLRYGNGVLIYFAAWIAFALIDMDS